MPAAAGEHLSAPVRLVSTTLAGMLEYFGGDCVHLQEVRDRKSGEAKSRAFFFILMHVECGRR